MRRRNSKPANATRRAVAIEIRHSDLCLVLCHQDEKSRVQVRAHRVVWRQQAGRLHSERGLNELTDAIKQLVHQHDLENETIAIALGGDFCVTRVVSGSAERVDRELEQLKSRSALYLSLGHGQKIHGVRLRAIDARHRHALMSVANRKTVETLLQAAEQANIGVSRIESSLIALSRVVALTGSDAEAPLLLVHVGQREAEVGISHRGQLLLEYRPADSECGSRLAGALASHLGRLQRYCDRYIRVTSDRLQQVYLYGEPNGVAVTREALVEHPIEVRTLDLNGADSPIDLESNEPEQPFAVALGSCLLELQPDKHEPGPDLLEHLHHGHYGPVLPAVLKTFAPLAAALLLTIGLKGLGYVEHGRSEDVRQRVAPLAADSALARQLDTQLERDQRLATELARLEQALQEPSWELVVRKLAQSLPEEAWLDALSITSARDVRLQGVSLSEEAPFSFTQTLRNSPALRRVTLQRTQPSTTAGSMGRLTNFDVQCQLEPAEGAPGT